MSCNITGRWNGRSYRIIRSLGIGANGKVYLVGENDRQYAIKISRDAAGVALEYRLLRQLQAQQQNGVEYSVQGSRLGPFVYDLDDFPGDGGKPVHFYTMEYIPGIPITSYVREKGRSEIGRLFQQLLNYLRQLHRLGYAFGDLKAENVLVNPLSGELRLVDFGGATRFGEGIRQYTEWYDRAYWNAGSRRADIQYDLFAAGMLMLRLLLPEAQRIDVGRGGFRKIRRLLQQSPEMQPWQGVLERAWRGNYRDASEMLRAVSFVKSSGWKTHQGIPGRVHKQVNRTEADWDWSHWVAVGSAVLCLAMILRVFMVR